MLNSSPPLFGLSGTLWPIHLKPQADELLSSWLVRLSHAHGYKVQSMCALLFGQNSSIWNRDIDRLAPKEIGAILERITGATAAQFETSTLRAYEGVLFERHRTCGINRWIIPLGIFHRSRRRPGIMFCPQCLSEDCEPYFRKSWRLAFSTVCIAHKCYLLDTCPQCESPIAPHRSDMQGRQIFPHAALNVHCWNCGFDLRKSNPLHVQNDSLVQLQISLYAALEKGYANWAGNPSMHSIVFFDGLRALISGLTSQQSLCRISKHFKPSALNFGGWPSAGLEMAPLTLRRELFQFLAQTVEDWPLNFINLIRTCNLRYSDLVGEKRDNPFWYENVIRLEARGGYASITTEEVQAIMWAVESIHGRFNRVLARSLSGRYIDQHILGRNPQPVSESLYEDLLVSIDHQIAGTLNQTVRACLIRDKIMFATGRQLMLSEGELANLTLSQLRNLVPNEDVLDFTTVARTPAQARAWVEWYCNVMRSQLKPKPCVDSIFTSERTGHGFSHSSVSLRFQRCVDIAMLTRAIPRYECWAVKITNNNSP